jgi:glycerol uptake facilitator-like aquaporin
MVASVPMKLFAEFVGTAALMLSILASGGNFLIIGATLGIVVFLIGGISGGSVNPAVSAGLYYSGSLNGTMFLMYSIAEILGALAAVYAYNVVS